MIIYTKPKTRKMVLSCMCDGDWHRFLFSPMLIAPNEECKTAYITYHVCFHKVQEKIPKTKNKIDWMNTEMIHTNSLYDTNMNKVSRSECFSAT